MKRWSRSEAETRSRSSLRAQVEPAVAPRVLKEKHLVLRLRQRNYHARAIFFDGASATAAAAAVGRGLSYSSRMSMPGEKRLQMHVQALRAASALD